MIQGRTDFLKERRCNDSDKPILQPRCPKLRGMAERIQKSGNPNVGIKKDVHPALALVSPAGGEGNVLFDLAGAETPSAGVDFN